jgi:signal transduction histidine kinase
MADTWPTPARRLGWLRRRLSWLRRRLGVRARSALAAAAVVAVALGGAGVGFVYTTQATLNGNVDAAASQRADQLAVAVASNDPDGVTQALQASAGQAAVAQVLSPAGAVEAASSDLQGEPPISPLRPAAGQRQREKRSLPAADDDPFRIVALGVRTPQGVRTVLVGQSLRSVTESGEAVTAAAVIGLPVLLVVVGLATFWFVGRSLRPVEAIRRRVAGITARDLHARVPVPQAQDEVAALAETMNGMLDRLETAATSQRRFVADASHELRSPLATIQAGLDTLATAGLPETAGQHIRLLRTQSERLGRLVSDLLLLARVDESGLALQHEDVDLDDLAYTERDRLAAQHPDLDVRTQIAPVRVCGDPYHLARALRNLTDNAARHAKCQVTLRVWADQHNGHIDVGDDGSGIPAADQGRIFERFVRLDDSRSRMDGGTGLGLPITREIVNAHGGQVTMPARPEPGLLVRITIPLVAARP